MEQTHEDCNLTDTKQGTKPGVTPEHTLEIHQAHFRHLFPEAVGFQAAEVPVGAGVSPRGQKVGPEQDDALPLGQIDGSESDGGLGGAAGVGAVAATALVKTIVKECIYCAKIINSSATLDLSAEESGLLEACGHHMQCCRRSELLHTSFIAAHSMGAEDPDFQKSAYSAGQGCFRCGNASCPFIAEFQPKPPKSKK
jgi:hypothetical protein